MYCFFVAPTTENIPAQFYQTFINHQRYKNCIPTSNAYSTHHFYCKVSKEFLLCPKQNNKETTTKEKRLNEIQ